MRALKVILSNQIIEVIILTALAIRTNGNNYCTDKPVIHVCTDSTGNNIDNVFEGVYMNTGKAPQVSAIVCRCTIMPATMNTISLGIQGDGNRPTVNDKFMIEINNVTLNDLQGVHIVEINGETELVYSSSIDLIGGFCLSIAPTSSDGIFSMTCVPNRHGEVTTTEATTSPSGQSTDTTPSRGHSTDTTSEPTISQTQTKPSNDAKPNSETNITLIAVIAGSIVGVALIAVVIIAIVCCKGKRMPDFTQATASHQTGRMDDAANGGQPNSAYENCGEVLQMHTSENGNNYEELAITNINSSSNNDYSKLHF